MIYSKHKEINVLYWPVGRTATMKLGVPCVVGLGAEHVLLVLRDCEPSLGLLPYFTVPSMIHALYECQWHVSAGIFNLKAISGSQHTLYFQYLFLFCSLWIKGCCCCCCCWERVAGARGPAYYRNVKNNMYSCLAGGIWLCGDGWFWSAAGGSSKHLWTIPVWNGTVCLCHTCLAIVSQKLR